MKTIQTVREEYSQIVTMRRVGYACLFLCAVSSFLLMAVLNASFLLSITVSFCLFTLGVYYSVRALQRMDSNFTDTMEVLGGFSYKEMCLVHQALSVSYFKMLDTMEEILEDGNRV